MADMQSLMALVQRLESQGVDVMGLLQGAAMGGAGSMGSGAITAGEEFMGRMGPRSEEPMRYRGPGAIIDGVEDIAPPYTPFEGPGTGAVMDPEQTRRMMQNQRRGMPEYMRSVLERLQRESGDMSGTRPVRPMPPGILKLLGGM